MDAQTRRLVARALRDAAAVLSAGFTEMTPLEAANTIRRGIRGSWMSGWLRNEDRAYKPKIADAIMADKKVRNAALNIMHQQYMINTDKELPFDEFLSTPIKLYRAGGVFEDEAFVSYSINKWVADKFARKYKVPTKSITIKPRDTLGMISTIAEAEVMVPPPKMRNDRYKVGTQIDIDGDVWTVMKRRPGRAYLSDSRDRDGYYSMILEDEELAEYPIVKAATTLMAAPRLKSKVRAFHCGRTWSGGKPSLKYVGSGEGSSSAGRRWEMSNILGPGIYFATDERVAEMYCKYGGTRPTKYTVEIDTRGIYNPRAGEPKALLKKLKALETEVFAAHPDKVTYRGDWPRVKGHKEGLHGPWATGHIIALLGADEGRKALRRIGITGVAVTLPSDGPGHNSWEIAVFDPRVVKVLKEQKNYEEEEALRQEFENLKSGHEFTLDFYGEWDEEDLTDFDKQELADARAFFREHGFKHEHL